MPVIMAAPPGARTGRATLPGADNVARRTSRFD